MSSTPKRLAIKLKPAAQRMVKKGHPWVFEGGITKQSTEGQAGDLAIIYDNKKNKFLACGLYDPHSPIRIKILQVHQSATINKSWFADKIATAKTKRAPLLATDTNSYRLVYGENDGLPSLIADVYDHVLVVKLYSAIWLPYLEQILPALQAQSACTVGVLRLSRNLASIAEKAGLTDGQVLYGQLEEEVVVFREHGILFSANVIHGHKTGYFLDHRHNRLKVGQLAKGKTLLDVFAYAGGFSVHALAQGATAVSSLDISAQALAMAQANAALNSPEGKHEILAVDAFKGLEKLLQQGQQYDIVVIDPPSFAKKETEVTGALHSYQRLASLGVRLVASGGLLVLASCTARIAAELFFETVERSLQHSGRRLQILEKTYHDVDHPIGFPEGAYLKCGYYKID
ncbi:MAG: class I SAM-dependent rRNA methyltransferase [Aureispira sp.]